MLLVFKHLVVQFEVQKVRILLLQKEEGALGRDGLLGRGRLALGCLPVGAKARGGDVGLGAGAADEGTLVVVKSLVQLKVDELGEAQRALFTRKRFLPLVKSHVSFQI